MNSLKAIIQKIENQYRSSIQGNGRNYLEVDMGKKASEMGFADLAKELDRVFAIVPLKGPFPGMKVRIDGRTFTGYAQFDSGIAVPGYVADHSVQAHKPYIPQDSMILNFV